MKWSLGMSLASVLVFCLVASARANAPERAIQVYAAQNRSAEELRPLAEAALAGAGRAVVDRASNTLLLSGDPEAVAQALEVLRSLDTARRTVTLRFESVREDRLEARGIDVRWSVRRGSVRVGNVRPRPSSKRRDPQTQIEVRIDDRARDSENRLQGTLRVAEGQSARISTGATIPTTTRTIERGRFGPRIRETTQLIDADSGLEARPRVLGNGQIEIALLSFGSQIDEDGQIVSSDVDTLVRVEPGETIALGGVMGRSTTQTSDGLLSTEQRERTTETLLLLTAELD